MSAHKNYVPTFKVQATIRGQRSSHLPVINLKPTANLVKLHKKENLNEKVKSHKIFVKAS